MRHMVIGRSGISGAQEQALLRRVLILEKQNRAIVWRNQQQGELVRH